MDNTLLIVLLAGLVTGFSKFSIGGMGLLILPILMIAFPGPEALGVILPIYFITDLLAVISYRKNISWKVVKHVLPLGTVGVVLGGLMITSMNAEQFTLFLGGTIVLMLLLGVWLEKYPANFMKSRLSGNVMGLIAGFVSMTSNAAGPLFSLYLMEQKISKESYVSTRAWIFFLINIAKIPMMISTGLLTWESSVVSLQAIPGLLLGAIIGHYLLKKLKPQQFVWLIRAVATMAAVKLFVVG